MLSASVFPAFAKSSKSSNRSSSHGGLSSIAQVMRLIIRFVKTSVMSHISVAENEIVTLINVFNVEPQNLNSGACARAENENSKGITRDRNDHSSTNTCGVDECICKTLIQY